MAEPRIEMIVADLDLARRLERAEGLANAEFVDARAAVLPEIESTWIEVAGALAMFDGADSPCTQTFGLGMFQSVAESQLLEVEEFFRSRGAAVHHEMCPLAESPLVELLNVHGYEPFEFSNAMFRDLRTGTDSVKNAGGDVVARLTEAGEGGLWARTAAEGWSDVAPDFREFILSLEQVNAHRRGTYCFLAEIDGVPVGAAALGIFEGVAVFAGACTIPEWRKRGAQRALLEYRLQFAAERGCDLAMIVAAPGSASQRNAERAGFRIAYTRTKWRLPTVPPAS